MCRLNIAIVRWTYMRGVVLRYARNVQVEYNNSEVGI